LPSQAREADLWDSIALRNSLFSSLNPILEKVLSLDRLRELYRDVRGPDGTNIFNRILQKMQVTCAVSETDLSRVPATGATVVVANHPFGILDGILLGALLLRVRPDVKILTNYLLTGVPELDEYCIPLDPFVMGNPEGMNQRGLRGAMDWLRKGGMLVIYPAGEVAHFQWTKGVVDPEWNTTAYRLARSTASAVLPVFIDGRNSVPFQLVGFIHPRLRTARLPQEFLQKSGSRVEVRIGKPEKPGDRSQGTRNSGLQNLSSNRGRRSVDEAGIEWLRWKTYVLANRATKSSKTVPKLPPLPFLPAPKPLANAVSVDLLESEIARLHPSACLESSEEYAVYCANAAEIPEILREIGRLRELTFREVGEGTGKSVDLDRFDDYYCHLFVWNKANREIVGAYRLAKTTDILARYGAEGLYTNTLFRFKPGFFAKLGPAVELGRSFVRPEYQRQYAPLLLLWKAIGRYVVLNPENPVLFGAVSISNSYAPASRTLMFQFFQSQFAAHPLSGLVQPRHPFRSGRLKYWDINAFQRLIRDPDELSGSVSEFEFDGKGIPILLKQYLKVGGQVLAFNVDGRFSDVLDGLIVVDLRHTDRKTLQRYLGAEGATAFLRHQQVALELEL
jgi:putative hemolysin